MDAAREARGRRIAALRRALARRGFDGLLVAGYGSRRYLSGYQARDMGLTESAGLLFIPRRGRPFLLTDSRYELAAREEAPDFEVLIYRSGLLKILRPLLHDLGVRRFAFESAWLSHAAALRLIEGCAAEDIRAEAASGLVERLRRVKDETELAAIRRSVQLNEEVFAAFMDRFEPGMTERAAARMIENLMLEMGAECPGFPTIVAAGENGAKPHAEPSERRIERGEPVVIDMGLVLDGYCSDMTRTVVLGRADEKILEHIRLVRRAQKAAIAAVSAGVEACAVDRAARRIIRDAGHGDHFGHATGHGVGIEVHEAPSLNSRSHLRLRRNMVVTVEPGVYIPGRAGVRLENMVVVTENGCEILNRDTTFLDP